MLMSVLQEDKAWGWCQGASPRWNAHSKGTPVIALILSSESSGELSEYFHFSQFWFAGAGGCCVIKQAAEAGGCAMVWETGENF